MLLKITQAITSRVQIKGVAKVLYRTRGLFRNKSSVYECYKNVRLKLDEDVLYQWWYAINYSSFDVVKLLERYLSTGSTMMDVGANLGFVSLNAARIVGPSGHVVSVDPQKRILERLSENIALNGVKNISVIPTALSAEEGEAVFNAATDAGLSRLDNRSQNNFGMDVKEKYQVKKVTLDSVIDDQFDGQAPDLIKIDVEGHEYQVLQGASRTLGQQKSIVILEVNPGALKQNDVTLSDILALVEPLGYEAKWIQSHSADWFRPSRQPSLTDVTPDSLSDSGDIILLPPQNRASSSTAN